MKRRLFAIGTAIAIALTGSGAVLVATSSPASAARPAHPPKPTHPPKPPHPAPGSGGFNPEHGNLSDCLAILRPAFIHCTEAIVLDIQIILNYFTHLGTVGFSSSSSNQAAPASNRNAIDPVLGALGNSVNLTNVLPNYSASAATSAPQLIPTGSNGGVAGVIGSTISAFTSTVSHSATPSIVLPVKALAALPQTPIAKVIKLQGISDLNAAPETASPFSQSDLAGMAAIAAMAIIGGATVIRRRDTAKAEA